MNLSMKQKQNQGHREWTDGCQKGRIWGKDGLRVWGQQMQAVIHKMNKQDPTVQHSSVQSINHVRLFVIPRTAAHQASLSITNFQSLLKFKSIKLVMPSNHFILCCLLLFFPSIFPSIRVFSTESVLCIRWPKYWSFSFSISPSTEYSRLISFRID